MAELLRSLEHAGGGVRARRRCRRRKILGENTEIVIEALDETNTRIRPDRIIAEIERTGGRGLVAIVGVQSNQFPRAVDLARPIAKAGIPVAIGGFHVSGCLAMLPALRPKSPRRRAPASRCLPARRSAGGSIRC